MITEEIQKVLNDLDKILRSAVGPRNRREYMREIGVTDRNWHFSLTADEIIKNKIPAAVIGCFGIARLFCKLAPKDYNSPWLHVHMNPIGPPRETVMNQNPLVGTRS